MRRFLRLVSLISMFFWLLVLTGQAQATDGLSGLGECIIEEDEVILDDFYFACNTLVIYGYIDGDIAGIASEVTIARQAHITGDVWMLGGQLTVEGTVGDDIHFAGIDLDITGLARFPNQQTDIVSLSVSLEISNQTLIPGDVIFYGNQAILESYINGNVDFQGQSLTIQNAVGGNVNAIVGDQEGILTSVPFPYSVNFRRPGLYITPNLNNETQGYINGNLNYEAPQKILLDAHVVGGETTYTQSVQSANITQAEQPATFLQIMSNYILVTARDVIALSLVGILTLNILSPLVIEPAYRVQKQPISAIVLGIFSFILAILIALVLILGSLLTIIVVFILALSALEITVMVSLILVVLNLGFGSGFFFLWAFLGRTITCFLLGFFVLRTVQRGLWRYRGKAPSVLGELWLTIVIGTIIVSSLVHLPLGTSIYYLQLVLTGAISFMGLGGIFIYLRDLRKESGGRLFTFQKEPQKLPPPIPPEDNLLLDVPLGTLNLPPGFQGFED